MDNSKKLIYSCHSHKGHLTKLLFATDEILTKLSTTKETDANPILVSSNVILLAENFKQLCLKANFFMKWMKILEDEEKLEAAVAAFLELFCCYHQYKYNPYHHTET